MIPSVFEAALRALLVAAAVWTGLRLMRVGNVLAQKAAWGLVLAAALLMPLLLPVAVRWNWPIAATVALPAHWRLAADAPPAKLNPPPAAPASEFYPAAPSSSTLPDRPAAVSSASAARSTIQTPPPVGRHRTPAPASLIPPAAKLAGMLYLSVSAALLLRLLYGLGSAIALWLAAKPVDAAADPAGSLRLRSSRAVASPVTIGSGVVLPDDYDQWESEKLRIVLAHERSHIRQGDFYLQLLAGLYAALFWFSPLGWWLKRKLSDLGEAISDRAGLEVAASRSSYAQILLEFAALPRPTLIGVAMARTSSLSHRIERLLNDTSFRQAFAGSRRRALLAVLMVPVALFAATALIRVQAAEAAQPAAALQAAPAPAQAPVTGQANPEQAPDAAQAPAAPPANPAAPAPPSAPPPPAGPGATVVPEGAPSTPEPPEPPDQDNDSVTVRRGQTLTITNGHGINGRITASRSGRGPGYSYRWTSGGDSYAFVTGPDQNASFSGSWDSDSRGALDKARKMAHGKFLWFTHDGKSYIVDDPAITQSIDAMYKPIEALGKQQEDLGRRQEELGKQQERLGERQEQASVPTPDVSKEMAELNAAIAKLQARKGSTVTQEDIAGIQGKIGDLQGKLGDIEGTLGEQQGKLGELQGKLGEQQGKLGEEQGRLGEQQGRIAQEADRKIRAIIQESLRNGKARPVE